MKLLFGGMVLVFVWGSVVAHVTPHDKNVISTFYKDHTPSPSCDEEPHLISYHVHALFWPKNNASTHSALAFRDAFIAQFGLSENCSFAAGDPAPSQTQMCIFEIDWDAAGPFPTAQLSFFVPPHFLLEAVTFTVQNKGSLDVLVHPNSGCETNDHTVWARWSGFQWPLDASIFGCDYPGCVVPN